MDRQTDKMFTLALVFVLSSVTVRSEPLLPSIAANLNKVLFVYPIGIQSERDLFVCPDNSACNIIYKRFWLPPVVERLCRCPQRHECDWTWSDDPDNYSMTLDNRSQMKFCIDLNELPQCGLKKPGIRTSVQLSNPQANATLTLKPLNSQKTNRHTEIKNVTAFCNCPDPHYWKLKGNSTKYEEDTDRIHQSYVCSKLKKCSEMEFCGYVRTDTYSTIYRCSCPKGHMCIAKDKTTFRVEEMLFNGHGYKAQCFPGVRDQEATHQTQTQHQASNLARRLLKHEIFFPIRSPFFSLHVLDPIFHWPRQPSFVFLIITLSISYVICLFTFI